MEMCNRDPNREEEDRVIVSELYLTHITDMDGFSLSVYRSLPIPETTLLRATRNDNRVPDSRSAGEYLGNQYAEIDEIFNDSVGL